MDRKRLKQKFEAEMQLALEDERRGELELAFRHLERAQILGQRWLTRHWRSHWAMLRVAKAKRESKEVRGQITRLAAVPLGWLTGWVPKGNTGGANVNPLEEVVRDMLRPLLKQWLDERLPGIVDEHVRREISRITGRKL